MTLNELQQLRQDRPPGWDTTLAFRIIEAYGGLEACFAQHGWSERGSAMFPATMGRIVKDFGSMETFIDRNWNRLVADVSATALLAQAHQALAEAHALMPEKTTAATEKLAAKFRRSHSGKALTPQAHFRAPLLDILERFGPSLTVTTIRSLMQAKLADKLTDGDLEVMRDGRTPRWWNAVCWERNQLKKEGIISDYDLRGMWSLDNDWYAARPNLPADPVERQARDMAKSILVEKLAPAKLTAVVNDPERWDQAVAKLAANPKIREATEVQMNAATMAVGSIDLGL